MTMPSNPQISLGGVIGRRDQCQVLGRKAGRAQARRHRFRRSSRALRMGGIGLDQAFQYIEGQHLDLLGGCGAGGGSPANADTAVNSVAAIDGTILILRIIDLTSIQFRSSAASQSLRPTPSRSIRGTGRRSLDNFARSFFGINNASTTRRRSMGCGKVGVFHLEYLDGLRY